MNKELEKYIFDTNENLFTWKASPEELRNCRIRQIDEQIRKLEEEKRQLMLGIEPIPQLSSNSI